jgi:NAD-dependent SIR2 family protein deacetylase
MTWRKWITRKRGSWKEAAHAASGPAMSARIYEWRLVCRRCGRVHSGAGTRLEAQAELESLLGLSVWACSCGSTRLILQHTASAERMSNPETRRMPSFDERPVKHGGTVFILGAGTSVGAGAPMANGFFRIFETTGQSGAGASSALHAERMKSIIELRNRLLSDPVRAGKEINIEELFGVTKEMDRKVGSKSHLKKDLLYFITQVLQNSLMFYLTNNIDLEKPNNTYLSFADKLIRNHDRCVVVTMNYDTIIEYACAHRKLCNIDYGLWRSPADLILADNSMWVDRDLVLLKIHGSINWIKCHNCGNLAFKGLSMDLFAAHYSSEHDWCRRCRSRNVAPLLVAPELGKSLEDREGVLMDLLAMAMREIHAAKRLVIIGHSLPIYDSEVRLALFWTALSENPGLQEMVVVDPSEDTLERYRREFAPVAKRVKMSLVELSFADFVNSAHFSKVFEA